MVGEGGKRHHCRLFLLFVEICVLFCVCEYVELSSLACHVTGEEVQGKSWVKGFRSYFLLLFAFVPHVRPVP